MRFVASSYVIVLCVLTLIPLSASAKVFISEVAWMGSADNANAEWVELYNDGPAQDLTNWTLAATDGQPSIVLEGNLGSGAYALLERTSDDTVPGVSAFLVYTGALGNTGETLELRNAAGEVMDRVAGGADWALGGDNTTKETLQRSGEPAVGAWITGEATPARGGGIAGTVESEMGASADTETTNSRNVGGLEQEDAAATKTHLRPALTLDLGSERTVTVGVPVAFTVRTYTESGREIVATDIDWNFGDGATAHGREATHRYAYPGDYVVYVRGNRGGFRSDIIDTAQVVVRVVEPSFAINDANEKYIEVANTGMHDLDLSNYALAVGTDHFRVPSGTMVLAGSSVRFPKSVTGLAVRAGTVAGIFYPDATLAQTYRTTNAVPVLAAAPSPAVGALRETTPVAPAPVSIEPMSTPAGVSSPVEDFVLPELASVAQAYEGLTGVPGTEQERSTLAWWLVGLVAAIVTAVSAVLLIRREQAEVIAGFEIEGDDV